MNGLKMSPELEKRVAHIENLTGAHGSLGKEMLTTDGGKFYGVDFLAVAVIKRSMSLCAAFAALVRSRNYTSAAALVRLQLDSCLRFYAAFIVEKPHEFAMEVLSGASVRKMKGSSHKKMTDKYLVPWLSDFDRLKKLNARLAAIRVAGEARCCARLREYGG